MNDFLHDRITVAVGTHYLIDGEIGRGGMAVVYRAVDLRLHRPVAIKVLPPDFAFNADVRARFLREAQTAAQLSHPNIVPIYAVDETDSLVYFVMGLVEGESLAALLAREPRLPVERVARILREVADGLGYAHDRGVVHRDVKPDNILIDRASGRAMVTDFGIARAAAESRLTVTGVAVGTPAYMSPEQALGESDVDGRSDVYSLGIVGYQMLVGETPFRAANTPAMLMKHVSEPPRPIRERRPDAPLVLALAVERALAKQPAERWATAHELRDALAGDLYGADLGGAPAWMHRVARAAGAPPPPPLPAPPGPPLLQVPFGAGGMLQIPMRPEGMSRHEWRAWARDQKHTMRAAIRAQVQAVPMSPEQAEAGLRARLERRISRFRHSVASAVLLVPGFFLLAAWLHSGAVFVFPSAFLGLSVLARAGRLWADGVNPFTALRGDWRTRIFGESGGLAGLAARAAAPLAPHAAIAPADLTAGLVPPEVLAGPFGHSVRRAAEDRAAIRDVLARLGPVEREMLPDVAPTADALIERVAGLAAMLHRLDADVSGAALAQLDHRIESLRTEPATSDRDRHLTLLERQHATLHDLLQRRRTLANQLERASLLLQNLKFDLLKLRSAGIDAALSDVTSVTQEARALSRDIAHLLDAAEDVRKL